MQKEKDDLRILEEEKAKKVNENIKRIQSLQIESMIKYKPRKDKTSDYHRLGNDDNSKFESMRSDKKFNRTAMTMSKEK
jgi:hypothetical protein